MSVLLCSRAVWPNPASTMNQLNSVKCFSTDLIYMAWLLDLLKLVTQKFDLPEECWLQKSMIKKRNWTERAPPHTKHFVRAFGSSEGSVEESFCSLLQLHHTRAAEEGIEAFCVGVGLNLTLLFAHLQLFFSDSLPSRSWTTCFQVVCGILDMSKSVSKCTLPSIFCNLMGFTIVFGLLKHFDGWEI